MKTFKDKLLFFANHFDVSQIMISEEEENWVELKDALNEHPPEWFNSERSRIATKALLAVKSNYFRESRNRNFTQCVENYPKIVELDKVTPINITQAHKLIEELFKATKPFNEYLGYTLGWQQQLMELTKNKYLQLNQVAKTFPFEDIIKYYSKFELVAAEQNLLLQTQQSVNLPAPEEVNAKFLELEKTHQQQVQELTRNPQIALFSVEGSSKELEKIDNEIILFGFDPLTDDLKILMEAPLIVNDYIRNKLENIQVEEIILDRLLSEELKEVIIGLHDPHEKENPYNSIVAVHQAAINL